MNEFQEQEQRSAVEATPSECEHPTQTQSRSQELREVNRFDPLHETRMILREVARYANEWAGLPMPLENERLIVEPSYPYADFLNDLSKKEEPDNDIKVRNSWYSIQKRCIIYVVEIDGKIQHIKVPSFHHIGYDMATMACSDVWGIEQEHNAVNLLGTMIRHVHFKRYLLTGMFLEQSPRSGITYIFRKLKPTVALGTTPHKNGSARVLASLCMHPIAFYEGSWAGAMCPTDDIIAHLTLMRGDEHMFWKRCNQHPACRPEAGL